MYDLWHMYCMAHTWLMNIADPLFSVTGIFVKQCVYVIRTDLNSWPVLKLASPIQSLPAGFKASQGTHVQALAPSHMQQVNVQPLS